MVSANESIESHWPDIIRISNEISNKIFNEAKEILTESDYATFICYLTINTLLTRNSIINLAKTGEMDIKISTNKFIDNLKFSIDQYIESEKK